MALAIFGNKVRKSYAKGKVLALQSVDMRVPMKSIYGLLGPSGGGKTTLLRCILGRLSPDSGTILVFGRPPGSPELGIPGSEVGYVPQELALYPEFSTREHLRYFGLIHAMPANDVETKGAILIDLLDLPDPNRLVKNLSAGQQRRVSLSIGLLHEPPLLILDEPTVGLDPLLRVRIWKHLQQILTKSNTAIVVTTHYIEEAMMANVVGLIRDGRIMAEAPPEFLVKKHGMDTLEQVFIKLCRNLEKNPNSAVAGKGQEEKTFISVSHRSSDAHAGERTPLLSSDKSGVFVANDRNEFEASKTGSRRKSSKGYFKIGALVWKNVMKLLRNRGAFIFEFFRPSFLIILYCLAIKNPSDINLGTVNLDKGQSFFNTSLGDLFLNCIDNDTITQKYYENFREAKHDAHYSDIWGIISIPENFSLDTQFRINNCSNIGSDIIVGSTIDVNLDVTDQQIVAIIKTAIDKAYDCFTAEVASRNQRKMSPDGLKSPINITEPFYGDRGDSYVDFLAPGVITTIAFTIPISSTALTFVVERKEGLLDRTWVAGVTVFQLMIAHSIAEAGIISVQILLVIFFAFVAFDIACVGSIALALLLLFLQGIIGMIFGLVISVLVNEETESIQSVAGLFFPIFLLGGVLWPIQSMPKWLQTFGKLLPVTKAAEAIRSITQKGWGMSWDAVWEGYLYTIIWIFLMWAILMIALKVRK